MTERNIIIMDKIVDELAAGKTISKALEVVYEKRNVAVPYSEKIFEESILALPLSVRSHNAFLNSKLNTINDVIQYGKNHAFVGIRNFGRTSAVQVLELILDFAWNRMNKKERIEFLIDTVTRNQFNVRKGLM